MVLANPPKFAFAIVPEVMTREAWLETVAKPALEKRDSEAPTGVVTHSTEAAPTIRSQGGGAARARVADAAGRSEQAQLNASPGP
jgi:hypothetical protein